MSISPNYESCDWWLLPSIPRHPSRARHQDWNASWTQITVKSLWVTQDHDASKGFTIDCLCDLRAFHGDGSSQRPGLGGIAVFLTRALRSSNQDCITHGTWIWDCAA